ncbi:trace amine-associated receptor 13c-like [Antennarius striatus]|uniref:trace amine-associated receptor 13c-like n=1 Tax=Antennarius striatus TaxID=241820 RepID=UPI0035AE0678
MSSLVEDEFCFPQLLNSSCRKVLLPYYEPLLSYITMSFISIVTVILNMLVIISISHFKQLHTPTNLLLLSLAVSDCIVGLCMWFQTFLIDGCCFSGDILCVVFSTVGIIITSASIGTMVLISVDRYVAICDPLHYSTKVTVERANICVCLCWMFPVLVHCLILKDNLQQPGRYNTCIGQCVIGIDYISRVADLLLSFIIPVTIIVVLYMRVFVVAVSQARAMRSHITSVTIKCSTKGTAKKSEMKAAITLGVVVVVFLICVCPYFCIVLSGQDSMLNATSSVFVITLFYFNSCLNPLIYALFYSWFRKSIKLIVTLKVLHADSCDTNMLQTSGPQPPGHDPVLGPGPLAFWIKVKAEYPEIAYKAVKTLLACPSPICVKRDFLQ